MSIVLPQKRSVYRHGRLKRLLEPRSIGIVGWSPNAGTFGARTRERLKDFDGAVYLINSKYAASVEPRCHESVSALPEPPDCVIVTVAAAAVESIVLECARAGVGAVVIFAAGYAETGQADRVAAQERLTAISREFGILIVGPNTVGVANYGMGAIMMFHSERVSRQIAPHSIGIVSQSGGMGNGLAQSVNIGQAISHVLSAGNSCDVDVADYVAYLAEDARCGAIVCLFEGLTDPKRLIEAAEIAWSRDKPLIVCKQATSEQGAVAARTHTGVLAGPTTAYRAALEKAGAIVLDRLEDLLETASFFAKNGRPIVEGVAVVSTSGGATVMAADKAAAHNVALPQPGETASGVLKATLPGFATARNPCDLTGQALNDEAGALRCIDAFLDDPQYGALLLPVVYMTPETARRNSELGQRARARGKAACTVLLSGWPIGPGALEAEQSADIAVFRSMDRCLATLAAWHRRERLRQQPDAAKRPSVPAHALRKIRDALAAEAGSLVGEYRSKQILGMYGVGVVSEFESDTEDEAVDHATRLGFPVVLKVDAAGVAHKSDAGLVKLALANADQVRDAYRELMANPVAEQAHSKVVIVQQMVRGDVELFVGGRSDPQFGPLVMVGVGGIFVEVYKDIAISIAPVSRSQAVDMLRSLKAFPMLAGARGRPGVDLGDLAEVVSRISHFCADHHGLIEEFDVNPLVCSGSQVLAVDALIKLHQNRRVSIS